MVAARSGRTRPIGRRLVESARTHEFIQLHRSGRPQHIFARNALVVASSFFFSCTMKRFHFMYLHRTQHIICTIYYILLYLLACDYFFFFYYILYLPIIIYKYLRSFFLILLLYYSHKTLPEHNANKVPSLEFYVREPNSTDPLSPSFSNYISLSQSYIFCRIYIYVPTAAGPADTAPAALAIFICRYFNWPSLPGTGYRKE